MIFRVQIKGVLFNHYLQDGKRIRYLFPAAGIKLLFNSLLISISFFLSFFLSFLFSIFSLLGYFLYCIRMFFLSFFSPFFSPPFFHDYVIHDRSGGGGDS